MITYDLLYVATATCVRCIQCTYVFVCVCLRMYVYMSVYVRMYVCTYVIHEGVYVIYSGLPAWGSFLLRFLVNIGRPAAPGQIVHSPGQEGHPIPAGHDHRDHDESRSGWVRPLGRGWGPLGSFCWSDTALGLACECHADLVWVQVRLQGPRYRQPPAT